MKNCRIMSGHVEAFEACNYDTIQAQFNVRQLTSKNQARFCETAELKACIGNRSEDPTASSLQFEQLQAFWFGWSTIGYHLVNQTEPEIGPEWPSDPRSGQARLQNLIINSSIQYLLNRHLTTKYKLAAPIFASQIACVCELQWQDSLKIPYAKYCDVSRQIWKACRAQF